jgi:hypothetical protein
MHRIIRAGILGCALGLTVLRIAVAADAPVAAADVVPGVWQHHKVTINYFGITSLYSCDGLGEHVRSILLHLGARKDAKVDASGCPQGPEVPSHTAWITSDFYTLAPADSASAETIRAHWAPREVTPHQPYFMGDGDCELIEQMKGLISGSFALRAFSYRTDCVPHEITVDGFGIKAEALVPVAASPGAVKG